MLFSYLCEFNMRLFVTNVDVRKHTCSVNLFCLNVMLINHKLWNQVAEA